MSDGGVAVNDYVRHLHEGDHAAAYAMVTAEKRGGQPLEAWQGAMNTDRRIEVRWISIRGVRTQPPGGPCVYAGLDFMRRNNAAPHGYYIFCLKREGSSLRVRDGLTYDRITGTVLTTSHFDRSREPFPCHSNGYRWLRMVGVLRPYRPPEHAPARGRRLHSAHGKTPAIRKTG